MNKAQGRQKMRMKQRMLKGTTATALFAALVVYFVMTTTRPVHATFSGPNGRISFALSNTNGTSIWSVRSDGSGGLQQLTLDSANQNSVDSNWSPDGSRIAFDRFSNMIPNIQDIFTMKADGSNVVQNFFVRT